MRKNLLVLFVVLFFGSSPAFAFAEDAATTTVTSTETTTATTPTVTTSPNTRIYKGKMYPTIHQEMKDAKNEMHTQMMEARSDFKKRLSEIKDEKKQTIITNIDSKINTINKKRTDEMYRRVNRLSLILVKISTKESELKAQGKITTALVSDIAAAQIAIDAAKQAVVDQAAKDYVVSITSETTLKSDVSTAFKQFLADIKSVYVKVVAAQTAVLKAHIDVAKLMGVTPPPTGGPTVTVTITPTVTATP